MGADGWIYIYDAEAIDKAGLREKMYEIFVHIRERRIFGRRIYTIYQDTQHNCFLYDESYNYLYAVKEDDPILNEIHKHRIVDEEYDDSPGRWEVWT